MARRVLVVIGDGKKTVDQGQVKERFKQLGLKVDWAPLDRLTEYRNAIEHYRVAGGRDEVAGSLAGSAKIVRQLISEILGGRSLGVAGLGMLRGPARN